MKDQGGRLLIVDDSETNRDMLARRLERRGYLLATAAHGQEALEMIADTHFDLILLDVMMPGMSGLDVLKCLRGRAGLNELPVIMATARDRSEDIVEALNLGANDYVTKPIDFPVLLARIQTQISLKRLSDTKDEFLRIASHDLKNPLTAIQGAVAILELNLPPGEADLGRPQGMLSLIRRRTAQMQRIISDFLDFDAMEGGRLVLEPAATDLNDIARRIVEENWESGHRKGIELSSELSEELPCIKGDIPRLEQVIQNLVGNAIKFGDAGASVRVATRSDKGRAVLEVRDTGPGLSEEDMKRLFVKYARLKNKPTGGEKSSGLGLYICKQIIELHGGEIGARSNPDRGATFWVSFPALSPTEADLVPHQE